MTPPATAAASPRAERQEALVAIRRLVRALRAGALAAERQSGISSAQIFVLEQLAAESAPSLNDLAERTLTHQSSVSAVVSRLAARQLVRRRPDPADARRRLIEITPKGRAILARSPATVQTRLVRALAHLRARERRALLTGLRGLLGHMGLRRAGAPLFFEGEAALSRRRNG